MPELILNRTTVVGLAIIGAMFSILASWCRRRELASEQTLGWLNKASYAFMGASIVLFIAAGLFGTEA